MSRRKTAGDLKAMSREARRRERDKQQAINARIARMERWATAAVHGGVAGDADPHAVASRAWQIAANMEAVFCNAARSKFVHEIGEPQTEPVPPPEHAGESVTPDNGPETPPDPEAEEGAG